MNVSLTLKTLLVLLLNTSFLFSQINMEIKMDSVLVLNFNSSVNPLESIDSVLVSGEDLAVNIDRDEYTCNCIVPKQLLTGLNQVIEIHWDNEDGNDYLYFEDQIHGIVDIDVDTDEDGEKRYIIKYIYNDLGLMSPHLMLIYRNILIDVGTGYDKNIFTMKCMNY